MRLTTHLGLTRPRTIQDQVEYFENKFGNLVDKTCQEVNGKIELPIFLTRVTCLPVSARTQHRSFIETNLANIPPPVTFENIWLILLGLFQLWTVHVFWILDPIVNFLVFIYFAFWTPIASFLCLEFWIPIVNFFCFFCILGSNCQFCYLAVFCILDSNRQFSRFWIFGFSNFSIERLRASYEYLKLDW